MLLNAHIAATVLFISATAVAQPTSRGSAKTVPARSPSVSYTVRVDSADTTQLHVDMRLTDAPRTFRVAIAAHPEYNERFWRYVRNIRATAGASIVREDSAVWRVTAPGGGTTISYSMQLPPREPSVRGSWRMFLTPRGGLVGGYDTFMYLPDLEVRNPRVTIVAPAAWRVASALAPSGERRFTAPDQLTLLDSPILLGELREWRFTAGRALHRVYYWNAANTTPFDSVAFLTGVRGLAEETIEFFGGAPYPEFTFLFQDAAYGGLEHMNSVTLGAPSDQLARNPYGTLEETAHEFIHSWNLMRLRPSERGGLDYRPNGQTSGLWWSEGLTLYYADVLLRRAGLPIEDSSRVTHVEELLERYLFNAGNTRISPERASLAEYAGGSEVLDGYDPNVHLQGELLGTALDLMIRRATGGRRSVDDVMRSMMARFSGPRGFTGADIENTVRETCGCDVSAFFTDHVRKGVPLDFNQFLSAIGMRMSVEWKPAVDDSGKAILDYRLRAGETESGAMRVYIMDPESGWATSGLRTGDELVSIGPQAVTNQAEFRTAFRSMAIGDTVRLVFKRSGVVMTKDIVAAGFRVPDVQIRPIPNPTAQQLQLRKAWIEAK